MGDETLPPPVGGGEPPVRPVEGATPPAAERPAVVSPEPSLPVKDDEKALGEARRMVHEEASTVVDPVPDDDATDLLGDFKNETMNPSGQITLPKETKGPLTGEVKKFKRRKRFSPPALLRGAKTATDYDSHITNYSTRTRGIVLPDGRRVFASINTPFSGIHRSLDSLAKRLSGLRSRKASGKDWKRAVEAKSNIPVIEYEDPHVVLAPWISNINASDLFSHNHEIDNFGPHEWARDYGLEEKMAMGERIVGELARLHEGGKTWGDPLLANIIVTDRQKPVIVDAEVTYDQDVSLPEQKARDLRDLVFSVSSALRKGEKIGEYDVVVAKLIDAYPDEAVKHEFLKLVTAPESLVQRAARTVYESGRLRLNSKEYKRIRSAIASHLQGPKPKPQAA